MAKQPSRSALQNQNTHHKARFLWKNAWLAVELHQLQKWLHRQIGSATSNCGDFTLWLEGRWCTKCCLQLISKQYHRMENVQEIETILELICMAYPMHLGMTMLSNPKPANSWAPCPTQQSCLHPSRCSSDAQWPGMMLTSHLRRKERRWRDSGDDVTMEWQSLLATKEAWQS